MSQDNYADASGKVVSAVVVQTDDHVQGAYAGSWRPYRIAIAFNDGTMIVFQGCHDLGPDVDLWPPGRWP